MLREDYYWVQDGNVPNPLIKTHNDAVNKIFNDHEAQLKQAYTDGSNSYNELIQTLHAQIQAKEEEINGLKEAIKIYSNGIDNLLKGE